MSCWFSKDTLALHVEGDLPKEIADATSRHLANCETCREFLERLRDRQALLKSLRHDTVSSSDCTRMRHDVMAMLNGGTRLGWALGIERAVMLAFRRPAYALATFAVLGVVSVSALAQMRQATVPDVRVATAVFEGTDTLVRPDHYRAWVLVDAFMESLHRGGHGAADRASGHRVYIDPEGYRAYVKTGAFPEGTTMIWESAPGLLASVKDSTRFEGGWGFFDFTAGAGNARTKAEPAAESSGCRTCHLEEAETDSVFTQFYSALRSGHHRRRRDSAVAQS